MSDELTANSIVSTDDTLSRARAILSRLVSFASISSTPNLPLIEWVASRLQHHDIDYEILAAADQEGKANLIATIGPRVSGGIVLSAHTDVVPVADQNWTSDPFTLSEREGRLYGRGSCDMKGFIASVLSQLPLLASRASRLRVPIHIVLTYDEEVGCFGAPPAIAALQSKFPQPSCVIVGEPSSMRPISGHKSISIYETLVTGFSGHSCDPRLGVSAVMVASHLVSHLCEMQDLSRELDKDDRFDPPWTSIHVGVIKGGTAVNIIAPSCHFIWDLRAIPSVDLQSIPNAFRAWHDEHILPSMLSVHDGCSIETTSRASVSYLRPEIDSPAERLVRKLTGDNQHRHVAYVTEAGQFQAAGISAIVCGPGSIEQAHKANEFLEVEQLSLSCSFVEKIINECC